MVVQVTPCHCMSRSWGKTPRCSRWRPCNDYCACCYLGLSTSKAKKQPITVLRNEKSRLQASAWFQRPDLWSHFISFDVIAIIDPGSRKLLRATLGGDGGGTSWRLLGLLIHVYQPLLQGWSPPSRPSCVSLWPCLWSVWRESVWLSSSPRVFLHLPWPTSSSLCPSSSWWWDAKIRMRHIVHPTYTHPTVIVVMFRLMDLVE